MTKFLRVFKSVASEFGLGPKIILVFHSGCLLFHHKLKTLFTINCLWLKYDSCQKLEQSNRFPTAVKEFSFQNKRKRTFCTTTTMAARNTLKILSQIFYKHLGRNFTRTSSSLAIVQERSGRHQFSHNLISRSFFLIGEIVDFHCWKNMTIIFTFSQCILPSQILPYSRFAWLRPLSNSFLTHYPYTSPIHPLPTHGSR